MHTTPINDCIQLAHDLRLGKIYPRALELVCKIEDVIHSLPIDQEAANTITPVLHAIYCEQIKQNWLGVADALEYDLPEAVDQVIRCHAIKMDKKHEQ